MVVAVLCGVCGAARAALDGCDDDSNNRITAELALCSVHAYNIGNIQNPTGADRQLMKDVIALKTTVITQQMEKQYEYLDSMIRRMKTQLEKAVLLTKLQAAGAAGDGNASSGKSYGGSYSGGGYNGGTSGTNNSRITGVYLDGAQNCGRLLDMQEMLNCLNSNYSVISNATNDGQKPTSEARQQLHYDINSLHNAASMYKDAKLITKLDNSTIDCTKTTGILSKWIQECLLVQANNIRIMRNAYQQSNKTPAK